MISPAEHHAIELVMGNVAHVYGFTPRIIGIARDSQSPTTFIVKHEDDDGGTCNTIVHTEEHTG